MGRIPPRLNRSEPRQDQQTTTVASVHKGQQDFMKRRRPCENYQIMTRRPLNPPKLTKIEKQRSTAIQRSRDSETPREEGRRWKGPHHKSTSNNRQKRARRRRGRGAGITGGRRSTTRAQEWSGGRAQQRFLFLARGTAEWWGSSER